MKAYTANGSDVAAIVQDSEVLPRNFPYPVTKVEFGHGSGAANTSIGQQLDVLVVDPKALAERAPLAERLGPRPDPLLRKLADAPATPLPVIATDGRAADARDLAPGHARPVDAARHRALVPRDDRRTRS